MYFLKKYRRGVLNRYYKEMPLFERFTKDLSEGAADLRAYLKQGFKRKAILAYPHFPSRGSTLYKIARALDMGITNHPGRKFQYVVYWEYLTFREEFALVEKLRAKYPVINLHNRDISKERVDRIHQQIFGYNTKIDPLQYQGRAVRKSDINAIHNYAVVNCPIYKTEPGDFYQILINNEVENGTKVEDIRVPIIGGTLDFVYLKHRDIKVRFKNPIYCKPTPIQELLSAAEIKQIEAMASAMHLEFGEMDVLRNRDDGQIYVIDVNNTPQGPPGGISKEDARWAVNRMAEFFQNRLLQP